MLNKEPSRHLFKVSILHGRIETGKGLRPRTKKKTYVKHRSRPFSWKGKGKKGEKPSSRAAKEGGGGRQPTNPQKKKTGPRTLVRNRRHEKNLTGVKRCGMGDRNESTTFYSTNERATSSPSLVSQRTEGKNGEKWGGAEKSKAGGGFSKSCVPQVEV